MDTKTMMKIAGESLSNTANEIARAARYIDADQLARIVDILDNCRGKVMITGIGTSGAAARKIAHSLACLEVPAVYLSPGDALHGASGMIHSEDVIIFISKGGRSRGNQHTAGHQPRPGGFNRCGYRISRKRTGPGGGGGTEGGR